MVDPHGVQAEIDVDWAPVISYLWSHGVATIACCQGNPGEPATVVFLSSADLERAITVLYDVAPEDIRQSIGLGLNEPDRWQIAAWPKLGWRGSATTAMLEGPAPFYFEASLARKHLVALGAALACEPK